MKTQLSSGQHQTLLFMPVWSLIFGILGPSVTCAGSLLGPEPDPSPARGIRVGQHHRGVHLSTPYLRLCICIPKCDRVAPRERVQGLWPAQQSREREILGERSGQERRRRKNTPRMLWLNMIRETHMARLRQNQMPSEVPMKHELKANTSPHYESEHILGNKPKWIVPNSVFIWWSPDKTKDLDSPINKLKAFPDCQLSK